MIIFEFDEDYGCVKGTLMWNLVTTSVTAEDAKHQDEIYQQLDAQTVGLA